MKKEIKKKAFIESRTSWKWFDRVYTDKYSIAFQAGVKEAFSAKVLLEILKELQYLNDKSL